METGRCLLITGSLRGQDNLLIALMIVIELTEFDFVIAEGIVLI